MLKTLCITLLCLFLQCNQVFCQTYLEPSVIDSLHQLQELRFEDEDDGYCLLYLPFWIKYCEKVERVVFNNTKKLDFDQAMSVLQSLPELNSISLEELDLREFPRSLFLLKNIKSLSIKGNAIIKIPKQTKQWKDLEAFSYRGSYKRKIYLKEKDVRFILRSFPKLNYLTLQDCNIKVIPSEICQPPLRYIDMRFNPISDLPACIYKSNMLRTFLVTERNKHLPEQAPIIERISVDMIQEQFKLNGNKRVIVDGK